MTILLLIDDDQRLGSLLADFFKQHAIELDHAVTPSEGFKKLAENNYDLVILDVMLPEMDGFEVCKKLRHENEIPIIMLTARGDVMDRVIGIELGADDYLPKPFEPRELVARIQRIIKRSKQNHNIARPSTITLGELSINPELRQVKLGQQTVELSSMEYNCLLLFATHPNKIFSRDEILNALKGVEVELFSRSIDILISRLRQKLRPHSFIKTIRGAGYCMVGSNDENR